MSYHGQKNVNVHQNASGGYSLHKKFDIFELKKCVQDNVNGTHQVLAYAHDVNLIGDDIRTKERNADVLFNACKDIGLAVNTGKTKYM